jgi:NAD(P)-dependent dehydrogenase (short-subunit alcohol dehydrogenase family)
MSEDDPFFCDPNQFKSKRVLVTGGTMGMGEAIVRRFALSGALVATTARSPLPEGQHPALFVQTDIGTADGLQAVVNQILRAWGGIK